MKTLDSYTCPKCDRSSPEVYKAKATTNMCNRCSTEMGKRYYKMRLEDGDVNWDINTGFDWLYRTTKGYSVKHINKARQLNGKPVFKHKGCYLWGDE